MYKMGGKNSSLRPNDSELREVLENQGYFGNKRGANQNLFDEENTKKRFNLLEGLKFSNNLFEDHRIQNSDQLKSVNKPRKTIVGNSGANRNITVVEIGDNPDGQVSRKESTISGKNQNRDFLNKIKEIGEQEKRKRGKIIDHNEENSEDLFKKEMDNEEESE